MLEAIDKLYIDVRTEQDKLAALIGAINHDVYEKRLTEPDHKLWPDYRMTPHSMYFYYVRINSDGRIVIDHYFYVTGDVSDPRTWKKIPHDEQGLHDLVKTLALNGRPSVKVQYKKPPRLRKGNFGKEEWTHKSYVAIFFDEANWKLRKKTPVSGDSAITFIVQEGDKEGTPNHTFFDAIDLKLMMPIKKPKPGGPPEDERSAIVFVNHMKGDEAGRDLHDKERQDFVFKLILDVKLELPTDPPTIIIIDPGGTNEGPPLPPPPE